MISWNRRAAQILLGAGSEALQHLTDESRAFLADGCPQKHPGGGCFHLAWNSNDTHVRATFWRSGSATISIAGRFFSAHSARTIAALLIPIIATVEHYERIRAAEIRIASFLSTQPKSARLGHDTIATAGRVSEEEATEILDYLALEGSS